VRLQVGDARMSSNPNELDPHNSHRVQIPETITSKSPCQRASDSAARPLPSVSAAKKAVAGDSVLTMY
jgi:hypothetical protein